MHKLVARMRNRPEHDDDGQHDGGAHGKHGLLVAAVVVAVIVVFVLLHLTGVVGPSAHG
jgi:hypothetical protein